MIRGFLFAFVALISLSTWAEEVPAGIEKIVPAIKAWGEDPVLVQAVKAQNDEHLSLDEIKKRDQEWMAYTGVSPFMKSLMENAAAKKLAEYEASTSYFFELFLMDNQGANVAMTNKTSDYWQGDEDKWTKSFNNGVGAVHIGKVKFDESAQAYLVQVSVPVMDAGKAIGAITIGINLDQLPQ